MDLEQTLNTIIAAGFDPQLHTSYSERFGRRFFCGVTGEPTGEHVEIGYGDSAPVLSIVADGRGNTWLEAATDALEGVREYQMKSAVLSKDTEDTRGEG